jgi:hypothetical protein
MAKSPFSVATRLTTAVMEILDRYLQTVKSALPDAHRDDIVNELSEDIHSEIEEKESGLGRPLSEAELEAILKQHGHPLIVAGRYRQDQRSFSLGRQLIGPVLFPFYAKVLSFNLGITSVVILIIFTALLASGQPFSFGEAISTLFLQLVIQLAIVTPKPWALPGSHSHRGAAIVNRLPSRIHFSNCSYSGLPCLASSRLRIPILRPYGVNSTCP